MICDLCCNGRNIKYKHQEVSVYKYCKINDLNYQNVIFSIKYHMKKSSLSFEKVIEQVIKNYQIKKERKKVVLALKKVYYDESYKVIQIAEILNINYWKIFRTGLSIKDSIFALYYFSDKKSRNGTKSISSKQLKKIKENLNCIKENELSVNELLGYYKMGSKEASDLLLERSKVHIKHMITKELYGLGLLNDEQLKQELFSELFLFQWQLLDRAFLNEGVISYFNKSLRGKMIKIIKSENYRMKISLEKEIFEGKRIIDVIPTNYNKESEGVWW